MTLRTSLRGPHRRVLVARARDVTERTARRSAVVLAPHSDDETIGCGATIARKTAHGSAVKVVVTADGGMAHRRAECLEACRRLGVQHDQVLFLGFPESALDAHAAELDAALHEILDGWRPDEVFAPSSIDQHRDHRALAASVTRLRESVLCDVSVLSYPVWFWNRWAWVDSSMSRRAQNARLVWRPLVATVTLRTRTVRTDGYLTHKRHALAAHESQVGSRSDEHDPLDPSWLALFLGAEELFFEVPAWPS